MTMTRFFIAHLLAPSLLLASCFAAETPADRVYRNGRVFTADAQDSIAQAVAIRDGRIVYRQKRGCRAVHRFLDEGHES
jgi:hypothetical protein